LIKECIKCGKTKTQEEFYKNRFNTCKECVKQYSRDYKISNKKRLAEYRAKNKDKKAEHNKKYYKDNKEKYAALNLSNFKKRYHSDPIFKMHTNISSIIRRAIKSQNGVKNGRTFEHLPYTLEQLKEHIESQFEDWMSWDNYGKWHIDHIYPQSKLPYDSLEHPSFQKCWALENLQPLEAIENIKKGNKTLLENNTT